MMRLSLVLLVGILAAGCAAPGGEPAGDLPRLGEGGDGAAGEAASRDDPGSAGTSGGSAAPPVQRHGALTSEQVSGTESEGRSAGVPAWWSERPVRRGEGVGVCAEATAPTLRAAREQAIKAAYARLEEGLGGPAASASIGSDYEVTEVAEGFRFRVRVTGSRGAPSADGRG
jgi:hypothetical protein